MELTQLEQFKVIAEYNSVTKASEKLFVTQSALSKALQKLEDELDVKLFIREKNGIKLNAAGKIAAEYVDKVFFDINEMKKALVSYRETELSSEIKFCAYDYSALSLILTVFKNEYPDTDLSYKVLKNEEECLNSVISLTDDVMFSFVPILNEEINCVPIYEDRSLVRVPLDHPLASKDEVSYKDLEPYEVLVLGDADYIYVFCDELNRKSHANIRYIYEKNVMIYRIMLQNNKYISYSSYAEKNTTNINAGVKYLRIKEKHGTITYYVSYLKKNEKRIRNFIDFTHVLYRDNKIENFFKNYKL